MVNYNVKTCRFDERGNHFMNLNLEEQRYPEIRVLQRKKFHKDFDRNEFEQKVLLPFVNIR
jgi:hypothetical protein